MQEHLEEQVKKTRFRSRFFGLMGMLLGAMILYVNPTYFGDRIVVTCGYWFFWFIASGSIFIIYVIFVKLLADAIYTLSTHHYYIMTRTVTKVEVYSTYFEALLISAILFFIAGTFLVFAAKCVFEKIIGQ